MSSSHHYGSNRGSTFEGDLAFDKNSLITFNKINWAKDPLTASPTSPTDLYMPVMKKTTQPNQFLLYTPVQLKNIMTEAVSGYYAIGGSLVVPTFVGTWQIVTYSPLAVPGPSTNPHPYLTQPVAGVFTVQKAGTYTITADLNWASVVATSSQRFMSLRQVVAGENLIELATNSTLSLTANNTYNSLSYSRYFDVGDTFQIVCGQTSGSNQTLLGVATFPANPSDIIISSVHTFNSF